MWEAWAYLLSTIHYVALGKNHLFLCCSVLIQERRKEHSNFIKIHRIAMIISCTNICKVLDHTQNIVCSNSNTFSLLSEECKKYIVQEESSKSYSSYPKLLQSCFVINFQTNPSLEFKTQGNLGILIPWDYYLLRFKNIPYLLMFILSASFGIQIGNFKQHFIYDDIMCSDQPQLLP